jgi:hypothetical protein
MCAAAVAVLCVSAPHPRRPTHAALALAQIVSYKWLARHFNIPSNYAKQ